MELHFILLINAFYKVLALDNFAWHSQQYPFSAKNQLTKIMGTTKTTLRLELYNYGCPRYNVKQSIKKIVRVSFLIHTRG